MTREIAAALLFASALVLAGGPADAQTLVANIAPGPAGSNPSGMTGCNGKVVFAADDGVNGREPWITDGTSAGTYLLADLWPGAGASAPGGFVELGRLALFLAADPLHGSELWSTDGTTLGTSLVRDIQPGPASSSPGALLRFGARVFFAAYDGVSGNELWTSDGSAAGTFLLKEIRAGIADGNPRSFAVLGDAFYFVVPTGYDRGQIWRSDGTAAGTGLLVDVGPLWIWPIDPTLVSLVAAEHRLYCFAVDPVSTRYSLVTSDGTSAGTKVVDLSSSPLQAALDLGTVGDVAVFIGIESYPTIRQWRSDGTLAGTHPLRPTSAYVRHVFALSYAYFSGADPQSGGELWRTDGTASGTTLVRDLVPGATSANPLYITRLGAGNVVLFSILEADGSGSVCVSDGRATGTRRVSAPGLFASPAANGVALPNGFAWIGDRIYFAAATTQAGTELWSMPSGLLFAARAAAYGAGCPGTSAAIPALRSGAPILGSTSFALRLSAARPNAAVVLLLAAQPAAIAIGGGCSLLVPSDAIALALGTSASGAASLPLAIPNQPALLGGELFAQAVVADPFGAFGGVLCFSDGLRVIVGW